MTWGHVFYFLESEEEMPSLQDALARTGLVTVRAQREAEAQAVLSIDTESERLQRRVGEREHRLSILMGDSAPDLFRREARKLLREDPGLLIEIINIAHARGFRSNRKGGARIIANLLQLRSNFDAAENVGVDKVRLVEQFFPNK